MRDPRLVGGLLLVQALALLALLGWWCSLTPAGRLGRLGAVMAGEHIPTVPPEGFVAQVTWLSAHRLPRLTGMGGLLVAAGLVGLGEGLARRRADVLGGFLLRWWTAGVVGLALVPGTLAGSLCVPWPLPGWAVPSGPALLVGLIMYGLTAGRPYVP
jgi:hypothetical protein